MEALIKKLRFFQILRGCLKTFSMRLRLSKVISGFFKESETFKIIYKDIEAFFINVGPFERFKGFLNIFSKKWRLFF
jgi:hypothetical protein